MTTPTAVDTPRPPAVPSPAHDTSLIPKKLARARPLFDREILGLVNLGAAAVVAAAGIALGILIGQGRAERREHAWAGEILAGDQLQATADAAKLGK